MVASAPPSWWAHNTLCGHVHFTSWGMRLGCQVSLRAGGVFICHLWSSWRARYSVRPSATLAPGDGSFCAFLLAVFTQPSHNRFSRSRIVLSRLFPLSDMMRARWWSMVRCLVDWFFICGGEEDGPVSLPGEEPAHGDGCGSRSPPVVKSPRPLTGVRITGL